MKDFRQLKVWQKSHELTLEVYRLTQKFPTEEIYGLISQIRRSVSSIPTNIAEGCGCESEAEFKRFLTIAYRSSSELDYQLILARDLQYLITEHYEQLYLKVNEIQRMLGSLIRKVKRNS